MTKIIRVNMTDLSIEYQDVPEEYRTLAGRAFTSTLIYNEVPADCHALGPNNKLVFAPGIVTGTVAATSARVSVGGKSPLTGTIKESNAGSAWAPDLAKLGIKALVVEGQPKGDDKGKFWMVSLSWDGDKPKVEFMPADEYAGQDLYEVFPKVFDRFGKVHIAGIGTAGELTYGNSGIVFDDLKGRPSR